MEPKKNILVVEDSETSAILIQSLFEENNLYKVYVENKSTKAIQKIKKVMPDIILLDLMLPRVDGFTLLSQIKEDPEIKDIPVVVVSAKTENSDVEHALQLGAIDYVKKPIGTNKLFERVHKLLENA